MGNENGGVNAENHDFFIMSTHLYLGPIQWIHHECYVLAGEIPANFKHIQFWMKLNIFMDCECRIWVECAGKR